MLSIPYFHMQICMYGHKLSPNDRDIPQLTHPFSTPEAYASWFPFFSGHGRQSMWTIEELSSLPRTHFRTRPGSSSELAQIIFWVCPGSHSMLPQDPLPTSKNPSGWIICMLTDLLPSNNMLQTLVSQDQLRLQDWHRTYPYNSLSIYRECRLMVRPHEGPFRSHWNKNVGIFNCTRGCQNDKAWCESTDEQVVTLMTFPFQWA